MSMDRDIEKVIRGLFAAYRLIKKLRKKNKPTVERALQPLRWTDPRAHTVGSGLEHLKDNIPALRLRSQSDANARAREQGLMR